MLFQLDSTAVVNMNTCPLPNDFSKRTGPLFPAKDKILPAISVSNYDLELTDASQVAATKRDEIKGILDTAEAYCLDSDYLLTAGNVVALYSHEEKLYLIGFCIPKDSQFAQYL